MAKSKPGRRTLDSYIVKHIGRTIRRESSQFHPFLISILAPGDFVLLRPSDSSNPSCVARVEKIESDSRGARVRVHVRWYYRPEGSVGGRRQFHVSKEVFLSDHFDVQSAETIEGKCKVHSFKSYTKLDAFGNDDFFCRFEYNSSTGAFIPDRVVVLLYEQRKQQTGGLFQKSIAKHYTLINSSKSFKHMTRGHEENSSHQYFNKECSKRGCQFIC